MATYSVVGLLIILISYLINIFTSFYLYKLTSYFIEFRNHLIFKIIVILAYSVIVQMIIWRSDPVNILFTLIGYLLVLLICSKSKFIPIVSVIMILYPIIVGINFFEVNNPLYESVVMCREYMNIVIIVRTLTSLIKAVLWYLLYIFLKGKLTQIKQYVSNRTWFFVDIICGASFLSIIIVIIFPPNTITMSENPTLLFEYLPIGSYLVILAAITSNIGVMLLLQPMIENIKMKMENQSNRIKEEYYNLLENQQTQIRKINHDMNNHFQMIESYLEIEDIEGAKQYFEQLKLISGTLSGKQFCKNQALNAILNIRHAKMEENNIDVHFNIDIDSYFGIGAIDLCTIFSNSLDNAIEASLKILNPSNRKVILKTRCEKECFSYLLTNNKANPVYKQQDIFISDKPEGRNHGYGIENIKEIVSKYNGEINISHTDDEFSLFLYIRLC